LPAKYTQEQLIDMLNDRDQMVRDRAWDYIRDHVPVHQHINYLYPYKMKVLNGSNQGRARP
jgi:oligoendopeptidase F